MSWTNEWTLAFAMLHWSRIVCVRMNSLFDTYFTIKGKALSFCLKKVHCSCCLCWCISILLLWWCVTVYSFCLCVRDSVTKLMIMMHLYSLLQQWSIVLLQLMNQWIDLDLSSKNRFEKVMEWTWKYTGTTWTTILYGWLEFSDRLIRPTIKMTPWIPGICSREKWYFSLWRHAYTYIRGDNFNTYTKATMTIATIVSISCGWLDTYGRISHWSEWMVGYCSLYAVPDWQLCASW